MSAFNCASDTQLLNLHGQQDIAALGRSPGKHNPEFVLLCDHRAIAQSLMLHVPQTVNQADDFLLVLSSVRSQRTLPLPRCVRVSHGSKYSLLQRPQASS